MRTFIVQRSLCFALGILLLEGTSSLVHALVLRDIPPEMVAQGVDVYWMLSRDILLSVLGGVAFAFGALFYKSAPALSGRYRTCVGLGFAYAVVLELLNWVLPNSLLAPATWLQGVIAWLYFVVGALFAAHIAMRWSLGAAASTSATS